MGILSYLKCWIKKETDKHPRRIYVGDVPFITDSETDPTNPLNPTFDRTHSVANSIEESGSAIGGLQNEESEDVMRPPPIPVRRSSEPNPTFKPRNQNFCENRITSSRYTVWNFLFKTLYQQFRRAVNFFFLTIAIIQSLIDSPISPVTALAPLIFVMTVTTIKQGYEDHLRHKADASVNNRKVQIVKDGEIVKVKSKDIRVGDIVKLELDEQVPTDLVLLASSDDYHRCQINTANLDGETNLKMRYCPSGLYHFKNERDFHRLHVIVECEQPNADLYVFNGNLLIPSNKVGTAEGSATFNPDDGTSKASGHPSSMTRRSSKQIEEEENLPVSDFLQIPLSMDNIVLRGTRVKNTDYIFGLVVYTGEDTRLAQNSKNSSPKYSSVEKSINSHLVVFMMVLAMLVLVASLLHYFVVWMPTETAWYIPTQPQTEEFGEKLSRVFNVCASFLILFNYIIPISLCVTVEMQKFIGSKFFVWDAEMASDNGSPPLCNTSDLNEELGQIEYLFSDKTGTLTENIMKFRNCSINDKTYVFDGEKMYLRNDEENTNTVVDVSKDDEVRKFLVVLALCHTVQLMPIRRPSVDSTADAQTIMEKLKKKKISSKLKNASSLFSVEIPKPQRRFSLGIEGKWEYQASSPDEKALLEACYKLEVIYYGEKDDILSVEVCGKRELFKRHHVLEFDADRKCMSVIVENEKGEILLLTKGAETAIIPICDDGSAANIGKQVLDFAMMGLRTLVVAQRKMTRDGLRDFSSSLKRTRRLLKNREMKMRELYRTVERHVTILGATGVEDQLQAGVPETLQALGAAGIRVWMLTGDKVETGVNVAVACGLITASSKQIFLTNISDEEEVRRRLTEIKSEMEEGDNTTFIIDGLTLAAAFTCSSDLLCEVTMKSFRVVCCRMAPLQKAKVVHMVKNTPNNPICAAVGDGANDVAMIQEAHIGIGILGKEGRQAARCSDFAVGKFCFLKKAILVHGHWYYVRLSILANFFFYKNFLFILPQVFFCFHSAFSTQALFEGVFLMFYNIFYNSCPIFFFGLLNQDYPAEVLLSKPHLYKKIRRNSNMSWSYFIRWLVSALWHAAVAFYIPYFSWSFFEPITDLTCFGTLVFCCIVAVGNTKMAIETTFVTWYYIGAQCFSYGSMFIFTSIYSELNWGPFKTNGSLAPGMFRHVYYTLLSSVQFYITLACVIVTALMPDVLYRSMKTSWPRVAKFWKNIPKKLKLGHMKRKSVLHLPQFTLLFSKRTGKLTVSNTTLTSYLPKQDPHV